MKANKKVILLNATREFREFFKSISDWRVFVAESPGEALEIGRNILKKT